MIRHVFHEKVIVRTVASFNLPDDFDPVWQTRFIATESDQSLILHQPVVVEDIQPM